MGHVNPAACLPRKESWRWETTNSEYGKFYVRKTDQRENNYSKKCEDLANELLEAKAQLERLKISSVPNTCSLGLQDEACQTSPLTPRPSSGKLYKTEKMEGDKSRMLKLGHVKDQVKHARPRLKVGNCKNSKGNSGDQDIREDSGRRSSYSCSVKDHRPLSVDKRKILQKQGGIPKKQKGSIVKDTSNNLKYMAGGGTNLPPSQRYSFYRNFGYAGQGAKTSKGWHSKTSPWSN